jgi:EpsI family protein
MAMSQQRGAEVSPPRAWFSAFPLQLDAWQGRRRAMEQQFLDTLQLDDYLLADYADGREPAINLYMAYYASQSSAASAHSPSSCLPGGGWRILEFSRQEIPSPVAGAVPVAVNRAVIEQGDQRQLVYYWFQQRGRNITSEYLVKWYLLVDSATLHRTDGAMVRLITPIPRGGDVQQADARLRKFAQQVLPILGQYVPG